MATENGPEQSPVNWPARLRQLCHDLNNPLAVIMGQMEIIEERFKDLPDDVKRRHAEMLKAAQTMREVIREAGAEARRAMGVEE
jgi:signal transduction histidine kinase